MICSGCISACLCTPLQCLAADYSWARYERCGVCGAASLVSDEMSGTLRFWIQALTGLVGSEQLLRCDWLTKDGTETLIGHPPTPRWLNLLFPSPLVFFFSSVPPRSTPGGRLSAASTRAQPPLACLRALIRVACHSPTLPLSPSQPESALPTTAPLILKTQHRSIIPPLFFAP